MFSKKENEDEWRRPGKVIGRDGKVAIVKQGESLKEVTRVHVTRLRYKDSVSEDSEGDTEDEPETIW